MSEVVETLKVTQQDEAAFYAQLGLNYAFAVCAVGDVLEQRLGCTDRKVWGFSISDMEKLGLTNTVYLGVGTYEKDSSRFWLCYSCSQKASTWGESAPSSVHG